MKPRFKTRYEAVKFYEERGMQQEDILERIAKGIIRVGPPYANEDDPEGDPDVMSPEELEESQGFPD